VLVVKEEVNSTSADDEWPKERIIRVGGGGAHSVFVGAMETPKIIFFIKTTGEGGGRLQ